MSGPTSLEPPVEPIAWLVVDAFLLGQDLITRDRGTVRRYEDDGCTATPLYAGSPPPQAAALGDTAQAAIDMVDGFLRNAGLAAGSPPRHNLATVRSLLGVGASQPQPILRPASVPAREPIWLPKITRDLCEQFEGTGLIEIDPDWQWSQAAVDLACVFKAQIRTTPPPANAPGAASTRDAMEYAIDVLERYQEMVDPHCTCEPCPECQQMPADCTGTKCASTCQCRLCDHCRNVDAVAALRASQPPSDDAARLDWLTQQQVDTIYLDDGRIIDVGGHRRRPHDLRHVIDEARSAPTKSEGTT